MSMTLDEFRQAKDAGVDLYEVQEDAAPEMEQQEMQEEIQEEQQEELQPEQSESEDQEIEQSEDEDIPKEHHSAWQKRAQREREKGAKEAEERLRQEYESQINPYKKFFDQLGVNPDDALKLVEQQRIRKEAEQMAYQNDWTDEQAQMYIQQQELMREQTEMRVSLKVYELADSPNFPGIKQMKGRITEFVRQNPNLSVEQAYWAVGGPELAQQIKMESEQREIAKRSKTSRKVVSDNNDKMANKDSLPPEAIQFAKAEGMTEDEVRLLLSEAPKNIDEYRKWKNRR